MIRSRKINKGRQPWTQGVPGTQVKKRSSSWRIAVVTLDLTGQISSWNAAAQTLLGYKAEYMVGGSMAPVIPEKFRARHVAGFHAAMDSGMLQHGGRAGRVKATTADGRVIDLAMTLGLLKHPGGTALGAVAVLRPLVDVESFVYSVSKPIGQLEIAGNCSIANDGRRALDWCRALPRSFRCSASSG
jgi:PAS domain S-box-containing protein